MATDELATLRRLARRLRVPPETKVKLPHGFDPGHTATWVHEKDLHDSTGEHLPHVRPECRRDPNLLRDRQDPAPVRPQRHLRRLRIQRHVCARGQLTSGERLQRSHETAELQVLTGSSQRRRRPLPAQSRSPHGGPLRAHALPGSNARAQARARRHAGAAVPHGDTFQRGGAFTQPGGQEADCQARRDGG